MASSVRYSFVTIGCLKRIDHPHLVQVEGQSKFSLPVEHTLIHVPVEVRHVHNRHHWLPEHRGWIVPISPSFHIKTLTLTSLINLGRLGILQRVLGSISLD